MGLGNKEVKRWKFVIHYFDGNKAITHTDNVTTKPMTRKELHDHIRMRTYNHDCCFAVHTKGFFK